MFFFSLGVLCSGHPSIPLFRVARDVFYPLVQDYPKTSQNILIEK